MQSAVVPTILPPCKIPAIAIILFAGMISPFPVRSPLSSPQAAVPSSPKFPPTSEDTVVQLPSTLGSPNKTFCDLYSLNTYDF